MLTPAEELGLSGLSLASRVRKSFFRITDARLAKLAERVRDESKKRKLVYLRDGQEESINTMLLPMTVLPDQIAYLHHVALTIQNALKRLAELYLEDAAVRELLRLSPAEEDWFRECMTPSLGDHNPIFGRLDALVDFISPMWKETLKFVEPNMSGIGGLHMLPTAGEILAEVIVPVLKEKEPDLQLELTRDIRELLMQEILEHLQAIGRPAAHICFIEPKYSGHGPEEQEALAGYYHERHGLKISHADPAELTLQDGEVHYGGAAIDIGYRDYSVLDLIQLQSEGINVEPMKTLFRQNRMISSIAAEIDQKSCWEVFTDPKLSKKYFSADERQLFRRHILWTRVVSDRKTTLPDGQAADLLEHIRKERDRLVLKPNRNYGGEGVVIGPATTQEEWEKTLEKAVADPERWVVQQLANIPVSEFPVLDANGKANFEPFYTVMGFAATNFGVAILGRASQKQVVNVAQRGGLCVVMQGRAPSRLQGPS
ncbi:MAG: hypothetical protein L0Y72_02780 [Gemmataceae bacterium]|nr:hypothetical protein [Gemmataceae bacterium]MCI0737942.1 hypothetical protein [Gemmataceae bacterium]